MDQTKRGASIAFALTLVLAVILGTGAFWPGSAKMPGPETNDKFMHYISFAVLMLPAAIFVPRKLIWLAPLALAYGLAIELVQPLVGREREALDLVADAIGIACGCLAGLGFRLSFASS